MDQSSEYPDGLLSAQGEERLEFFKDYTVAHPKLMATDQKLKKAIQEPASKSLIFVYGPTGVGKTTMLNHVEQELMEEYHRSNDQSNSNLPLATVEAPASESGNFNWKDFYIRVLKALNEPFIEDKIEFGNGISRNDKNQLIVKRSTTKSALRRSLEKALEYRTPQALIIDEAQHLTHMSSGRRLRDQLECLKSLANISETTLVLIGTYDLLAFRNLSGQLSRRSIDIHFERYLADHDEEQRDFKRVIKSFESHLPEENTTELMSEWSYLYERSIGCVGILKDWITIAYSNFLKDESTKFELEYLEDQALRLSQCEKILSDIQQGEDNLRDSEEERHNLRRKLGLEFSENEQSEGVEKGRNNVGIRNPERDPVGQKA